MQGAEPTRLSSRTYHSISPCLLLSASISGPLIANTHPEILKSSQVAFQGPPSVPVSQISSMLGIPSTDIS